MTSTRPQRLGFGLNQQLGKYESHPLTVQMAGGKISQQEIDQFLQQIEKPAEDYLKQFPFHKSGCYIFLIIISALILPLIFFFLCYDAYTKKKKASEIKICRGKIQAIANEHNGYLVERGLAWTVEEAPWFIELWVMPDGQSAQQAGFQGGISMMNGNIPTKVYPQENPQQTMFQQNQYNQQMYNL